MSKEKNNSLLYIKFFILIVIILMIAGLVIRLVSQYQERSFTQNTFNILIISDKYVGVMGVDDINDSLSAVLVTKDFSNIKRENVMIQSINFGIPIHGYIIYPEGKEPPAPTQSFLSFDNVRDLALSSSIERENISLFDWIRLYFAGGEIDTDKVSVKSYATINDLNGLISEESEDFFRDSDISTRKTSLQIVNGTTINGLGSRVAEMYSRVGFNVVSVTTEQGIDDSEIIYSEESMMNDVMLVKKSFDFPINYNSDYQVADITLIIGEDSELALENIAN